ncbi:MAG: hypothetical protein SXA11_03255 [Cyanobacteriota bacterium]|nr:hypothetical protein [Cyanobacteriota bacterium]
MTRFIHDQFYFIIADRCEEEGRRSLICYGLPASISEGPIFINGAFADEI